MHQKVIQIRAVCVVGAAATSGGGPQPGWGGGALSTFWGPVVKLA